MTEYVFDFDRFEEPDLTTGMREAVVRCRDCEHLDAMRGNLVPRLGVCNVTCRKHEFQLPLSEVDRGFCAWGESRGAPLKDPDGFCAWGEERGR